MSNPCNYDCNLALTAVYNILFVQLLSPKMIYDWILGNRSKLHIGSFKINDFKDLRLL